MIPLFLKHQNSHRPIQETTRFPSDSSGMKTLGPPFRARTKSGPSSHAWPESGHQAIRPSGHQIDVLEPPKTWNLPFIWLWPVNNSRHIVVNNGDPWISLIIMIHHYWSKKDDQWDMFGDPAACAKRPNKVPCSCCCPQSLATSDKWGPNDLQKIMRV